MSTPTPAPRDRRRFDLGCAVATLGGIGFFPVAPATLASLVVCLLLLAIGADLGGTRLVWVAALAMGLAPIAVWSASRAEERYGHDARPIVIDEVLGVLIAAWAMPWDALHLLVAFLLFRVFDVLKPPPVYQLQSYPGGLGVLLDDVGAGLYALGVGLLARLWIPGF